MDRKYIPNDMPLQSLACSPKEMLESTLSELVRTYPPIEKYPDEKQKGIFSGYTSLIYLLFRISALHPDLKADGRDLRSWIEDYMSHLPHDIGFKTGYGGIHSEKLSVEAIRTCMTGAEDDLNKFLQHIGEYLGPYPGDDPYPAELFYGRAGVLYILRMVKHYIPKHSDVIQPYIEKVAMKIMEEGKKGEWTFANKRFLGPCHGDIGIITQLVLSLPHLAPSLQGRMEELLNRQHPDGNWPKTGSPTDTDSSLVQFCHGAPGFAICLKALRPYFPDMHAAIDTSIEKAEKVTWEYGLLRKEPSICHGIFGNALYVILYNSRNLC